MTFTPTHEVKLTGPAAGKNEWLKAEYVSTQVADPNGYLAKTRACYHHFRDENGHIFSVRFGSENTIRPLPGYRMPSRDEVYQDVKIAEPGSVAL